MKIIRKKMIGDTILEFIRETYPNLTEADIQKVISNIYQRLRKARKDHEKEP